MTTPNDATGATGLVGSQIPEPPNQAPRGDDAFEAGVDNAVALVALSIANRLSTDRVDSVAMEYMDGFCGWLEIEAETIRTVVDLLAPDSVENHDVSDFLDGNTDLTPLEVTVLIAQVANLSTADGIDTVLHHAGVPSREELLALADYLEELAQKLSVQMQPAGTQATGGQGGEPVTMTSATAGIAPEPTAVAEQRNATPASVGHGASHIDMTHEYSDAARTAGARHAETAHQPGHVARRS